MCTATFLFQAHSTLLLLLAFNRDEYFDRQTEEASFWEDAPDVLAGRDKERGGTWLGITRKGRFAFLTNIRVAPKELKPGMLSRGALTTSFLTGSTPPLQYLQQIHCKDYNGFNLVVGDLVKQQVAYLSSHDPRGPVPLLPGLYGVSNGVITSSWIKVQRSTSRLARLLGVEAPVGPDNTQALIADDSVCMAGRSLPAREGGLTTAAPDKEGSKEVRSLPTAGGPLPKASHNIAQQADMSNSDIPCGGDIPDGQPLNSSSVQTSDQEPSTTEQGDNEGLSVPWDQIFSEVLNDAQRVQDDALLPVTGCPLELERAMSSVFVPAMPLPMGQYGTRSQTVVAVTHRGQAELREHNRLADGQWGHVRHVFTVPVQD